MNERDTWSLPPADLSLTEVDVHVWCANLTRPKGELDHFLALLSADERERAGRFYFERDRHRFIVARGVLRSLIGRYLRFPPDKVQFAYASHGKPHLAAAMNRPDFEFNVAHSQDLALFAFTYGRSLGVDVEFNRLLSDADTIADRYFSARESAIFRRLPSEQKQVAFFNCWTRKEAFIKAVGEGLSFPLDQFEVTFAPGERACLLEVAGDVTAAGYWSLEALEPAPGYPAALVVSGREWRLSCWRWPD